MQNVWSYIKDSGDFLKMIRDVGNTPEKAILVTADAVWLYPDILNNAGLKALNNKLEAREHKAIPTEDLVKMARFVLENNYFEFHNGAGRKFQKGQLGHSLHRVTLAYLWMNLKPNLYNCNHSNLWYGLDTSTTFTLFGLMAKRNLKGFQIDSWTQ